MPAESTWPDLIFSGEHDAAALSRAVKRQTLRRLGRGIYTGDLEQPADDVVRDHIWAIIGHEFPAAVVVDRTVRSGGLPVDDAVFVAHSRQRPLELTGTTIWPRRGPGALEGDMPFPNGVFMSSPARALLDNLAPERRSAPMRRKLRRAEIEDWIDGILRQDGADRLNAIRDHARRLAPQLGREPQMKILDALVGAAFATRDDVPISSDALKARSAGTPFDPRRIALFRTFADELAAAAPQSLVALPIDARRRALLPFYDAYFSNFIEGTEFTIDEAAGIVFDHATPLDRPQDAHDVSGTYEIVSNPDEMKRVPRTFDELDTLLRARHATLMASRPDRNPGEYKRLANRAGATEFVLPELVIGTLRAGFDLAADLHSPLARSAYMMFLVAEVHPFTDGNGRIARIMMNAELAAGGEVRIIIPTVYRNNYLSALRAGTFGSHFGALIAVLQFAQRYTARVDFSTRETAEADLDRTNAFRDSNEAESAGVDLTLP
jgi:hypothetical protein